MSAVTRHPDLLDNAFQRDAEHNILRIKELFKAVIEPLCGGAPRAHEVADTFDIHRKLGWHIWNVAYEADPLRAIRFMPSDRALSTWQRAAEKAGVPGDLLRGIADASELFGELIKQHSGDRDTLDMLLETCEETLDQRAEERYRKQAFQGNSFIWGVRANTYFATFAIHPSQRSGFFDVLRIHGLIDLIRTRPNVRWPFSQAVVYSGDDERFPTREPIAPSEATDTTGVPLIADFCSRPLPPVQRRPGEHGMLEDELLPGPVGQTGRTTIITGEVARELASVYKTQPGEDAMFGTGVRTPCETFIHDHLVHRDLFPEVERDLRVYSELISPVSRDERDLLQVSERIEHLGRGTARLRTAEIPNYMELMSFAFERMSWNPDDFDLYRIRMRFPPMPIAVMLHHDLPDPPGGFDTTA